MDTTEKAVLPDESVGGGRGSNEKRPGLSDRKAESVQGGGGGGDVENGMARTFSSFLVALGSRPREDAFGLFEFC